MIQLDSCLWLATLRETYLDGRTAAFPRIAERAGIVADQAFISLSLYLDGIHFRFSNNVDQTCIRITGTRSPKINRYLAHELVQRV